MDGEKFMDNLRAQLTQQSSSFQNAPSESTTKAAPSSSSIKSKKSSNLLSAFVRRTRNKSKHIEKHTKTAEGPSQNLTPLPSCSSVGLRTEEVEFIVENYERKLNSLEREHIRDPNAKHCKFVTSTDSEHSIRSGMKIKHQFFRKLIKRQTSNECEKKKILATHSEASSDVQTIEKSWEHSRQGDHTSEHEVILTDEVSGTIGIPTSYIQFPTPMLNIPLINGLRTVQELAMLIQETKKHLIDIFKKYISDVNFQKELVRITTEHSKLQWEAETRNSVLESDMWMYQVEIGRKQERILQETLNSLVRQNRQLQIDYEILFREHEKLSRRLQVTQEHGLRHKCVRDCNGQIEQLLTHNKNLQSRMESYIRRVEVLEDETCKLQKEHEDMDHVLNDSSLQIQSLRVLLHESRTNYELEMATLSQAHQKSFEEAFEASDRLMEDLDSIKRQMEEIPSNISWSNLKSRGSGIADMIHLCRSFVKEIAETLLTVHTKLTSKDKDMDALRDTNCKLQESLKKSTTELNDLSKKIKDTSDTETDNMILQQKCKLLENDLKTAQEKLEKTELEHNLEKSRLLNTISQYEHLNNEILEKNNMIEQTKLFITNISTENMALRNQVDGLNKILSETGAGDVVRELTSNQEQLLYYQSQYYQVLNEKQRLLDQQEIMKADNKAMLEHQELNYKHLQEQLKGLDKISKENRSLRQQFEKEHHTVLSLQNERKKYLEEKDLLKAIFHHLKSEICRVQKLEGTVSDISKEANKLAMIAEYNKQLGKKLKTEIIEKDKTILLLKTSVEKLNDIQIKDTKEKLSLCYELSEVCQMKDQLNSVLSLEVQKNLALDDSKKEVVQTASTQQKMYEDFQKKERSVLKDLLRDLKTVVRQRDALVKERENLLKELADLRTSHGIQMKKFEKLISENNTTKAKLDELDGEYEKEKAKAVGLHDKFAYEVGRYNENVKQLEKLIVQLRNEKGDLENSIEYLQNNLQKLHNDLNETRKNEKETKDMFNACLLEKTALTELKYEQERKIETLNDEKEKLSREINHVNMLCEKILSDFESNIKSSIEKEELYKKEIQESKLMIMNNGREIEQLSKVLAAKQGELQNIISECNQFKQKEKQNVEVMRALENQKMDTKELKNRKEKLEYELSDLKSEHENMKLQLASAKQELESVYKQLKAVMEQKEEEYRFYKKHMDDTLRQHEALQEKNKIELNEMKLHLNDLAHKLENERSAYSALSQIHKDVSAKFIKSIKDVVDEKSTRQEVAAKLKEAQENLENLKSEKSDLQHQVNLLLDGLNDGKNRINTLTQERDDCQKSLDELQKRHNEILRKCLSLENQIRGADLMKDAEMETFKVQIDMLKKESEENHNLMMGLRQELTDCNQKITSLEFQRSELTLRLHEMQRKFETEKSLCQQLNNTYKLIVAAVLKMKDDENATNDAHYNNLLQLVQNNCGVDVCAIDEN